MTGNNINNIGDSNFNSGRNYNVYGGDLSGYRIGDDNYNLSGQQNLAEAAAEIQKLLALLEQRYPTDTTTEKMVVATEAIKRIDSNPTFKKLITNALKAGRIQALAQLLNHPAASFVIGALEDWYKSENLKALEIFIEIGDRYSQANTYQQLGMIAQDLREYEEARHNFQQALEIFIECGAHSEEAVCLSNLGQIYSDLKNYQQAIACFQQSLRISQEISDRNHEAHCLSNLGHVCSYVGDYQEAIDYYEQSLTISQEIGDRNHEAHCLSNLGHVYSYVGDYQEAITLYNQSLWITELIGDVKTKAATLHQLALIYAQRGDIEDALALYNQSLELTERIGDVQGKAATLHELADIYANQGEIEQAIAACTAALQISTRAAFPQGWARTQMNLGTAYSQRILGERSENLELAIAAYHAALEVFTRTAFPVDWARTQNNLGEAYRNRIRGDKADNLERAIACYSAVLAELTREAFPENWASTQYGLGNAYLYRIRGEQTDNIEFAIARYEAALTVYTQNSFSEEWAKTHYQLGQAYYNRIKGYKSDNIENAIKAYITALEVYTRETFPQNWAQTQINLGIAYKNRIQGYKDENLEAAIACYQAGLTIYTRETFPVEWARTQNSLGLALSEKIKGDKAENLELAIACYQAALTVYTRKAFPYEWASTCKNLGNAYTEKTHGDRLNNVDSLNNIEYAILFYQDALEIYTPERFPDESAIIREKFSNAHYLLEHYQRELEFASLPQSITHNEALARIEFVQGDLLALDVDALVNPTGLDVSHGGAIGLQLFQRLGSQLYKTLQNQPLLRSGEVFVTDAGSLPAHYIIHTPTEEREGRHTTASIIRGVSAALAKADSLSNVRTIAFPSVGTGAAGFDPADLAPKVLRAVTNHLKQGTQLEKVIFTFIDEFAYQVYVSVYQTLLSETSLAYGISLTISKEATGVGGEIEVSVYLKQMGADNQNDYLLRVPQTQAVGSELNIILTASGFQFDSDNTASLPLDPDTAQQTQTARFRLTALRPGNATITAELYRGDTFETNLETTVQVAGFDEESFLQTRITTQPRPVPQPDFILRVQPVWNETNFACIFNYQLRSFRFPTVFSGETNYQTVSFSNSWLEQMRGMLANTLENISGATREDGKSSLVSLGQYLFQHLFPSELQSDFRNLIPQNAAFTLLILGDQDAWIPWELLHDGQKFLGDRFIIGRWLQELNDTRPYEFPVGAVNVAHYANVEQPELWTTLLETPGAPPPQPLPAGVLHDSTEAIRGLHLIRYSQSSDAANRRNAPVTLDNANNTEDIEHQIRPAKLNLRRNRLLATLGYVKTHRPELTTLEQTWASAFIQAGCSGFLGSLWAVDPDVEAAFISSFYNRLWIGASLGEAFYTSCQLARTAAPDSLDYLAYVLFGDPMARPYRPVEGKGYAVVEPIGREIDDPLPPGVPVRFRLTLRRTPPVWHEERVIEVAENLTFENLQVHVKTIGLQVTPDSPIAMSLAPTGNYLGWFTLVAPSEMAGNSALVQVYFMDGVLPIHSLMFSLNIAEGGETA